MSDPPKTLKPSNKPPLKPPITTTTTTATSSPLLREHRKGNWTIQETLVLITAKKLDEERRVKPTQTPPDPTKPPCKPGSELRWKWVENYCWNHGCLRSQTQCNDKWDNLIREYKKVRDYESKSNSSNESLPSYWDLEKQHRKDRNLPSNMSFEVFQALNQVLQRRYSQTSTKPAEPVVSFSRSPAPATEATVPPVVSGTAEMPQVKELFFLCLLSKYIYIYIYLFFCLVKVAGFQSSVTFISNPLSYTIVRAILFCMKYTLIYGPLDYYILIVKC